MKGAHTEYQTKTNPFPDRRDFLCKVLQRLFPPPHTDEILYYSYANRQLGDTVSMEILPCDLIWFLWRQATGTWWAI